MPELRAISGVGSKGPACFLLQIGERNLLLDLGRGLMKIARPICTIFRPLTRSSSVMVTLIIQAVWICGRIWEPHRCSPAALPSRSPAIPACNRRGPLTDSVRSWVWPC